MSKRKILELLLLCVVVIATVLVFGRCEPDGIEVRIGQRIGNEMTLLIKNASDSDLHIDDVQPSCSCVSIDGVDGLIEVARNSQKELRVVVDEEKWDGRDLFIEFRIDGSLWSYALPAATP